jgi:hypothetical protein
MVTATATELEPELADMIGKVLAVERNPIAEAVDLLAGAIAEGAFCDRASRREVYPALGPVGAAVLRLADPAVPGNTARMHILLVAAHRRVFAPGSAR